MLRIVLQYRQQHQDYHILNSIASMIAIMNSHPFTQAWCGTLYLRCAFYNALLATTQQHQHLTLYVWPIVARMV